MRILTVYSSRTGNTKKVAEAIHSAMPSGADIYPVESAPEPDGYDFIAVGYWAYRGTADDRAAEYMRKIRGKKVVYFGTLGAYPDSEHANRCRRRVGELLEKNEVLGEFLCHGKIDPASTERQMKLPEGNAHRMDEKRLKRHMESRKHPDEKDLTEAKKFIKDIMKNIT